MTNEKVKKYPSPLTAWSSFWRKVRFGFHLKEKKIHIGLLKWLSSFLPREVHLMVYKTFIRPPIDYTDIVIDKVNNGFSMMKPKTLALFT